MKNKWCIALWAALGIAAGCASSRESSSTPDCGCGEEPDGSECVDTDTTDKDGGVPGWRMTWAAQAGGETANSLMGEEIPWDLEALPDGSVVVAGRYVYEAVFGAGEPNETVLPHFSPLVDFEDENSFVALYGRDGELIWARGFGGAGIDVGALGVKQAGDGSLWVNGGYDGDVTFGLGQLNETTLVADFFDETGLYSHALARYSTAGEFEWATRASDATHNSTLKGSAILPDGSIAVAGLFSVGIAFAPGTPEETIFTTPDSGDEDAVIARFAEDGSLMWAKRITGPGREFIWSAARLLDGDLLVSGIYQQTVVLGEGEADETLLTCGEGSPDGGTEGDGENCPFLASYTEDGALLWARDIGYSCPVQDVFPRIEAAPDGGFAVSGGFVGTAVLGAGEPNETALGPTPEDRFDLLVARYAADGSLLWARQSVGGLDDPTTMNSYIGYPMAFLDSGELVLAGAYRHGAPVFGQGEPHETILPNDYDYQIFIALYYPNGNLAWAIEQGGPSNMDFATSVAAYGDSTFFVGGSFGGTAAFGTSAEDQKTMTSNGDTEIFVLRFDRAGE